MADTSIVKAPVTTVDAGAVVEEGLDALLGGEAAGTAAISDGAGGVDLTSADVSAMLAAADDAAIRAAIGAAATVTTTRGDMPRRGASADERLPLGATGTALRSDGTDPVWSALATAGVDSARPSASLTLLGALYTATDLAIRYVCESDGSGGARWAVLGAVPRIDCDGDSPAWTDSAAGGATAAFTGGVATLTAPSGVAVGAADRARTTATLASLSVPDPWRVRMEARLQTYDAAGSRRAALGFASVASINGADYSTGDMGVFAFVLDAGTLSIYDHVASTFTLRATSSATLALDGQDWLALELRAESIRLFRGRGSTRPTSWDLAATATWGGTVGGTLAESPAYALLSGYRTDTTASVFTAAWSGVRVQGLL